MSLLSRWRRRVLCVEMFFLAYSRPTVIVYRAYLTRQYTYAPVSMRWQLARIVRHAKGRTIPNDDGWRWYPWYNRSNQRTPHTKGK